MLTTPLQHLAERDGVIWCMCGMRPLPMWEYEFWMNHPLPFGWSIIVSPTLYPKGE